jgi:hemerythrin-like domain-containing protein
MNTATKNLEDDHVHILKLTDVMEKITKSDSPDIANIEKVVDIIRNFADGLHHAKEENLFFPLLAEKGFSLNQGPVAVMLNEHVQGRNWVKGISDNIILYKKGNNLALKSIYQNMLGYVELLRNHISKENNILFRMADNVLSDADNRILLSQFEAEQKSMSAGNGGEKYIAVIESLATFYKV